MIKIVYYVRLDGSCPFTRWFDGLDPQAAAKVTTAIERLADGNMGNVKPVGEGVSERRLDHGPGYRIYFGRDGGEIIVLLTGGSKKRQQADIQWAKKLRNEYKRRKKDL